MYERAHVDQVTALSVLYLQPSLRRDAISPPAQAVLPSRMTNAHECGRTAHAAPFCAHSAAVSLVTVGVTVVGASNVFCLWYGVGKGGGGQQRPARAGRDGQAEARRTLAVRSSEYTSWISTVSTSTACTSRVSQRLVDKGERAHQRRRTKVGQLEAALPRGRRVPVDDAEPDARPVGAEVLGDGDRVDVDGRGEVLDPERVRRARAEVREGKGGQRGGQGRRARVSEGRTRSARRRAARGRGRPS